MAKMPKWKVLHRYIFRSSRDPESLARGVGLGLFVGFLPSIGLQMILALFFAGFLKANRIVAMAGTLVSNPLTNLPLSAFSIWLGDWVLPGSMLGSFSVDTFEFSQIWNSSGQLVVAYLVGCLLLSIVAGTLGYGFAKLYFGRTATDRSHTTSA